MKKHIEYKTKGTCSRMVVVDVDDGIITDCNFVGGCAGNTQGVARLVVGMRAEDAIAKLRGIKCGFKSTSCPDQLSLAIEKAITE
jgi:uncharacterized protein (TIGR03905 family)